MQYRYTVHEWTLNLAAISLLAVRGPPDHFLIAQVNLRRFCSFWFFCSR